MQQQAAEDVTRQVEVCAAVCCQLMRYHLTMYRQQP